MGTIQYSVATVVGGIAALIFIRYQSTGQCMFVNSDRSAYAVLFSLALIMCSFGIQMALQNSAFKISSFVTGGVIGLPLLVVSIVYLMGKSVPLIGNIRNGLILLASLMLLKWLFATAHLIAVFIKARA